MVNPANPVNPSNSWSIALAGACLVLLLGLPGDVFGCTCRAGAPQCQTLWQHAAVFSGEVIEIDDAPPVVRLPLSSRRIRFRVDQRWRGEVGNEVDVFTGSNDGDCGFPFRRGTRYLVYARGQGQRLVTGICSPTKLLADAAPDLAYLSTAFKPSAAGRIFGRAIYQRSDSDAPARPASGYVVTLKGDQAEPRTTTTASDGGYAFESVTAGRYAIALTVPSTEHAYGSTRVELLDPRGCASNDFSLVPNGRIATTVAGADGRPSDGVTVEVVRVADLARPFASMRTAQSGANGTVEISELPPDRYVIGININRSTDVRQPYPRYFYPGVTDARAAAIVEVRLGERVELPTLVLPAPLREQRIIGVVLWPDGSPAVRANVALRNADGRQVGIGGPTDEQGRFVFVAHASLRYRVSAFTNESGRSEQWSAKTSDFEATADLEPLRLVLQRPRR